MTNNFYDKMTEGLEGLSLRLHDSQIEQFYKYYEMMIERNKVVNLTAITEMDEVITKHFIDSLSIIKMIPELPGNNNSFIDIGTGAGFPGIPLKIAFPECRVTLLDSLNKRIKFLEDVSDALELEGIVSVHGRAEDFGRDKEYREKYDYCVSRAVANLSTLAEYCMPFVKVGGAFIPYKSGRVEDELEESKKAVYLLGGKIEETKEFLLPGTDMERILVKIAKVTPISSKYPRKAGLPGKEPLK